MQRYQTAFRQVPFRSQPLPNRLTRRQRNKVWLPYTPATPVSGSVGSC